MSGPRSEKPEEDVEVDPHVAGSRDSGGSAGPDSSDDSYVGRASSDDDFDTEETGAEKRAD
jgi:hypothetical protein